jgi:hypothetical protein
MVDQLSMYEWLKGHDILEWLRPLWDGGGWTLNKDGKVEMIRNMVAINTPWVHHGHTGWAKCMLWNNVMFRAVSQNIGKHFADMGPFVPSGCQNCFKVVVRPQTLIQLFALDELEIRLGRPSKCGIELRESVHGLYGGYFYNQGKDAGLECYREVRQAVDQDEGLGSDVAVILKRSCTEMEHLVGPSDQWEISEEQKVVESLIEAWTVSEKDVSEQPEPVIWNVKRRWIEWAFAHGDETYKQVTGGKSIVPGYVTYHQGV